MANYKQQSLSKTGSINFLGTKQKAIYIQAVSIPGSTYVAIDDINGTDIQATTDSYIGYIDAYSNIRAANMTIGYADDITGTNFVKLIFNGAFLPVDATWTEHTQLYLKIPATKYLLIYNTHASIAGTVQLLGYIHES